jgi:hypothetical protein
VVDEYSEAVVKLCIWRIEVLSTTLGEEPHILGDQIDGKTIKLSNHRGEGAIVNAILFDCRVIFTENVKANKVRGATNLMSIG